MKKMDEYEQMAVDYIKEAKKDDEKQKADDDQKRLEAEFKVKHKDGFLTEMQTLAEDISKFVKMTPQEQRAKISMTLDTERQEALRQL